MEKVKYIVISLFTLLSGTISAQSWITGISADYQLNRFAWDSTKTYNTVLELPSLTYDQTFQSKLTNITSLTAHGGMHSKFKFNKNLVVADLQIGLSNYTYSLNITKKTNSFPLDTTINEFGINDSITWSNYKLSSEDIAVNALYPSLRVHVGYERELLRYKSFVINADAGFYFNRKFSFFQGYRHQINETNDSIFAYLGPLLNHRKFIPSSYIGISFKYTSHQIGIRLGSNLGSVTRKGAPFVLKETFAQVTYTKLLKETHLGREQVLYDEYQHLSQTRASEYRQGDKYSYLHINIPHNTYTSYSESSDPFWVIENNDSIQVNKEGNLLQPNIGFGLMFNTFFTHRWMMGLGVSMYSESYSSYGTLNEPNSTIAYGTELPEEIPDNSFQEYWTKNKAAAAINSHIYISKRTMKIDPFVKGTVYMVLDYDVPDFLKDEPGWRTTSFFPVYQIGAGFDIRLRIKSSKFFVIGAGVDYNINPHTNYLQCYARVGYYRKKKLKNQRY